MNVVSAQIQFKHNINIHVSSGLQYMGFITIFNTERLNATKVYWNNK